MNKFYKLSIILLSLCLGMIPFVSQAQVCNPTENWLTTNYPGENAKHFTELNGKLYTIDFNVARQEYILMQFDGFSWIEMSSFDVGGVNYDLITYNNEIYLGGTFNQAQINIPNSTGIIRWDSASNNWVDVGGGTNGYIFGMGVYQGELYVGGTFDSVGVGNNKIPVRSIARWDGTSWDSVGPQSGITVGALGSRPTFYELVEWNNKLVIGGNIEVNGKAHVVTWDGTSWGGFPTSPDREVRTIGVYQNDLIVHGFYIKNFGTQPIQQFARWDGVAWQSMGMNTTDQADVRAMVSYRGDLFVVGSVSSSYSIGGGLPFYGASRWDGTQWHTVTGFDRQALSLGLFQGRLYASGHMASSCNNPVGSVIKLCLSSECQPVSGSVYQDDNGNCIADMGEFPLAQKWISIQPGNHLTPTDAAGNYSILLDSGTYTVDLSAMPPYYSAQCPANGHTVTLTSTQSGAGSDFALTPIANVNDLEVSLNAFAFRPGFTARIYLNSLNAGTTSQTGSVDVTLDPKLTFTGNASIPVSSQTGNTLSWNFSALAPSQGSNLWIEATLPATAVLGDTICLVANIHPMMNDTTPGNNVDTLKDVIVGSYDPNDKRVVPAGIGPTGDIPVNTEMLTYTIRFQNTGTDTAFTVVIRDEIDENLDLSTLQTLASSHAYNFNIEEGQGINWTFNNILLADSNTNEPASHGFVTYRIKLKENLSKGTRIENTAAIYFDFNSPIITNTTVSTLSEPALSIIKDFEVFDLKVWPQPAGDVVNIEVNKPLQQGAIQVFDLQGRLLISQQELFGKRFQMPLHDLSQGLYLIRVMERGQLVASGKLVIK